MSNATEIKEQYTLGELPEVVKRLITESRFVASPDCTIRFTAVSTEDCTKQERRAVNTALCLAVGQLPQAHGYFDGTLLESQLDQSDVLIKATTMTSGDEHTVYITITTNRCKDLIADMTLSWLTCFVKLHKHSCQGNSKPTQEKEKEMTISTHEKLITLIAKEMENFDYDHVLTPVVIVGNNDSLSTADLALKVIRTHTTFNTVKLVNLDKSERVTDKYAIVVSCQRNGVIGVYHTSDTWVTLTQPLLSVNLNFINPQTPEKKEETMTENTQYVKNDNALAEILAKMNSAYGNPDTTVLLKPLDSEGNQITLTHHANMLVGQILAGTMRGRKAECYSAETYNFDEGNLSDRFYITIGFNRSDLENINCLNIPKGAVPVVVKFNSSFNRKDCVPVIFEGFVDPVSGVGYRKTTHGDENTALADTAQLTAKLREVANYAKQVGIMMFANVSIPKLQFFLSENPAIVGMMHKVESTWDTQVNLVNELMTLANKLGANATVNINATIQGNPAVSRNQSFGVMNNPDCYVQPNVYPSATNQQPPFPPNFFNGFHPQNHMPHNPCQPGLVHGVGNPFASQGGPTVQGFKSQPNS